MRKVELLPDIPINSHLCDFDMMATVSEFAAYAITDNLLTPAAIKTTMAAVGARGTVFSWSGCQRLCTPGPA